MTGQAPNGETSRLWKLARDVLLAGVGIFMLVHETLASSPNELILGAALVLLGLPATLRFDESRRK